MSKSTLLIVIVTLIVLTGCDSDNLNNTVISPTPLETKIEKTPVNPSVELSDEEARLAVRRLYRDSVPIGFTNNQGEIILGTESYEFHEEEFQKLLTSVQKKRDVKTVISYIREELNSRLNHGNRNAIEGKEAPSWNYIYYNPYADIRLYQQMDTVISSENFKKDMNNAASLATLVKNSHSIEALAYLHQIIKDLDDWLDENQSVDNYLGVTYSASSGDQRIQDLEKFLLNNK